MAFRERLSELRESVEERAGVAVMSRERAEILEARSVELGATKRELDALAWTALNYESGRSHDLKLEKRKEIVQQALVVWMKDPQAGAAVDLMNDFVFGRGIPKPRAKDEEVQKVIDEFWDDVDNKLVLTTMEAQAALGVDLSLQSNLFLLVFDDGEDGKVKLDILDHDTVIDVIRDQEAKQRILFYVVKEPISDDEWDFDRDQPSLDYRTSIKEQKTVYYAHWRNLQAALDDAEAGLRPKPKMPPAAKLGDGRVYHIAINRTTKMAFGHPVFDRLIRWYNAYNAFIDARLDIIQAKAAYVMRRKVKGTPNQLQRMATQAISLRGALAAPADPMMPQAGPRPGSIENTTDSVTTEDVSLDTGAAGAMQDAQMIRAQTSAATRFPQSYYGDSSNSNLATATSLELPVLKAVEARQEVFEGIVRFAVDRAIERAVDTKRLAAELGAEELQAARYRKALEHFLEDTGGRVPIIEGETREDYVARITSLIEAHEDKVADEEVTQRDLSYEFKMPNPLKRLMNDIVTGVQIVATTFDPNGTNIELSRFLLALVLSEAFEVEDAQGVVDDIFPPGYQDPAVAAAQGQQGASPFGEFAPSQDPSAGADGQQHPDPANPYGAPMRSSTPEQMQQAVVTLGRDGRPVVWSDLQEADLDRLPPSIREALQARRATVSTGLDGVLARTLVRHALGTLSSNGAGRQP